MSILQPRSERQKRRTSVSRPGSGLRAGRELGAFLAFTRPRPRTRPRLTRVTLQSETNTFRNSLIENEDEDE